MKKRVGWIKPSAGNLVTVFVMIGEAVMGEVVWVEAVWEERTVMRKEEGNRTLPCHLGHDR